MRSAHLKKLRAREHGTILLLAAVTILIVVGMLALAVDIGYLMNGRGQLQNAVDAAALAGAQGLQAAIEPAGSQTQQGILVRRLAKEYAALNSVKKVGDSNSLLLSDSDITIDFPPDYPVHQPRVMVKHRTQLPTIFANIFGFSGMNVSAGAITSTTVVDGGTGMISGCWRPILIPDTFYDVNRNVWAISGQANFIDGSKASRPNNPNPDAALGDFYVSRFASSAPNSNRKANLAFIDPPLTPLGEPTGIRDARTIGELKISGGRNLIAQRILLRPTDYRIIDFAGSGFTGDFPSDPVSQIQRGCCTPIQVGQLVKVYAPIEDFSSLYQSFRARLSTYLDDTLPGLYRPDMTQYRYVQTHRYPTPNTNPRIIPVLLCSPLQFDKNVPAYYVTNFGAFYLETITPDGSLAGFFVREVVTAGMPLQAQNEVLNSTLLPVSVNLIR